MSEFSAQNEKQDFSNIDPEYLRKVGSMWMKYSEARTLGLVSKPEEIDVRTLRKLLDGNDILVLDVRDRKSFEKANIAGSINIEGHCIDENLVFIPRDKKIVVMCYGGGLSQVIAKNLSKNGFDDVVSLEGGIEQWASEIDKSILDKIWTEH